MPVVFFPFILLLNPLCNTNTHIKICLLYLKNIFNVSTCQHKSQDLWQVLKSRGYPLVSLFFQPPCPAGGRSYHATKPSPCGHQPTAERTSGAASGYSILTSGASSHPAPLPVFVTSFLKDMTNYKSVYPSLYCTAHTIRPPCLNT